MDLQKHDQNTQVDNNGQVFHNQYGANPGYDTGERAGQPAMDPQAYQRYNTNSQINGQTFAQPTYDPNATNNPFNQAYNTQQYQQPVLTIDRNRHAIGFIGALIGTIIGGAVWTGIGCLGFISGWIAILIFFLAQFFYKKFNKGMDMFGVIVCIILGFVAIFPATWCVYSVKVSQALGYEFWDVCTDLPFYLKSNLWVGGSQWGSFVGDLVKSYLFTVFAAVCTIPRR